MLKRYAIAIFCPPLVGVRPRRAEEHTDVFRAPYAGYPFACRWARRGKNKNARERVRRVLEPQWVRDPAATRGP